MYINQFNLDYLPTPEIRIDLIINIKYINPLEISDYKANLEYLEKQRR